eukprot:1507354-Amphidinium_carterae.1
MLLQGIRERDADDPKAAVMIGAHGYCTQESARAWQSREIPSPREPQTNSLQLRVQQKVQQSLWRLIKSSCLATKHQASK